MSATSYEELSSLFFTRDKNFTSTRNTPFNFLSLRLKSYELPSSCVASCGLSRFLAIDRYHLPLFRSSHARMHMRSHVSIGCRPIGMSDVTLTSHIMMYRQKCPGGSIPYDILSIGSRGPTSSSPIWLLSLGGPTCDRLWSLAKTQNGGGGRIKGAASQKKRKKSHVGRQLPFHKRKSFFLATAQAYHLSIEKN